MKTEKGGKIAFRLKDKTLNRNETTFLEHIND